jgi:prepilin peptidase CpaA
MLSQPALPGSGEILLGVLVAVAAYYDIRYRRIPNWLVLAGLIVGIVWNAFAGAFSGTALSGGIWSGLLRAGEGLGLGFALLFPFYLIRALGAGDVKLMAAIGAIAGPGNCFWVFIFTGIIGGVAGLILAVARNRVGHTFFNVGWILSDLLHFKAPYKSSPELDVTTSKGMRLPYGAVMAGGVGFFILITQYGRTV